MESEPRPQLQKFSALLHWLPLASGYVAHHLRIRRRFTFFMEFSLILHLL